ncbi:MAG: phosphoglucosamine mutase [Ruminococcaceae bacterium]|nr:phosphoglucosamine mutase [Oscillospiraceae bacterium]
MGRLFGTDGVRGIANTELTTELAMDIGRAAATVLSDGCRRKPTFVIGSDTRASSDMLGAALIAGLCSVGANVVQLGVVPTPAVAHLVRKYKADAGVMISASHNPAEFNGIKIFNENGFKLPDMIEEKIEDLILEKEKSYVTPIGGDVGKATYATEAAADYIRHIKSTSYCTLDGMKIAIDCANGAASVTAPTLFSELGADVHILSDKPDGVNINRNCGSTHLEALAEYVVKNGLECGIAFDGDADRCLCVDEAGNVIDGDMIMAVCALDLKNRGKLNKNTVVGTIMSNFGFGKFCEDNDLRFIATKVGDRYVLEEMLLEDYSFGGEQSGHVIFRDYATTGDGQLTATQLLMILRQSGKKLSELASVMTRYPQTMVNLKISAEGKIAFYTDREISEKLEEAKAILGKTGRIVVRPSGTEPLIRVMVEGSDTSLIEKIANDVAALISERLGNK